MTPWKRRHAQAPPWCDGKHEHRRHMRRWRRLYFHIYAGFLLVLSLSVAAAILATRWIREEQNEVPRHLARTVEHMVAHVPHGDAAALTALGAELGVHLAVFGPDGALEMRTDARFESPGADAGTGWTHTALGWGVNVRLRDGRLAVSVPADDPIAGRFRRFAVAIGIMLLIIGLGSYKLARRLARRLDVLVEAMDRFGEGDLKARAHVPGGQDDVGAVAQRFNAAAERIEQLVTAERRMTANASHELRSPLARIRLALELARGAPSPELIDGAVKDIAELDRLVEDLLVGARLQARGAERGPVDVLALIHDVAPDAAIEAPPGPLEVALDERAVRRAVRNLVDNAAEHAGGVLRVVVAQGDGEVSIAVEDAGPLTEAEVAPLFEPFARRPGSRGSGLGLSLARDVAEAHGGTLTWAPRAGGGSVFRLTLR